MSLKSHYGEVTTKFGIVHCNVCLQSKVAANYVQNFKSLLVLIGFDEHKKGIVLMLCTQCQTMETNTLYSSWHHWDSSATCTLLGNLLL